MPLPRMLPHSAWMQLLLIASGRSAAAAEDDSSTCRAGSPAGCESSVAPASWRPRWRKLPYYGKHKTTAYGGPWVEKEFQNVGFEGPVEDDDWDLMWSHRQQEQGTPEQISSLPRRPGRLVNHCQYFKGAGQKCLLASHLNVVQRLLGHTNGPKRYLTTYHMKYPDQVQQWTAAMEREPDRFWLVKTCTGGASKGIVLVKHGDTREISDAINTWAVAQEYMHQPLLSEGRRKFHMRFYLVVTSWDPVAAFLYDKGLVFRSRHKHRRKPTLERDVFSQIKEGVEPLELSAIWDELGPERATRAQASISQLLADVLGHGMNETFGEPSLLKERGFSCWDFFGVDIMFDERLQPFLLEFNIGPNLMIDKRGEENLELQLAIKEPLLRQMASFAKARVKELTFGRAEGADDPESSLVSFTRLL